VPNLQQFRLPDVGEGLTEADILNWSVQVGDAVEVNQILVEIETAKAAVELPSPYAGVVAELHAQPGETVEVGRPIVTIDTGQLHCWWATARRSTPVDIGAGEREPISSR
jgi:2-oxoisovalerate dehydrogenase E2 component (dihydrolipoyl transacylase)